MALLREFERSGLSMAEFCRRREVGYSTMAAWRRAARRGGAAFVEVEPMESGEPPAARSTGRLCAELMLPGGACRGSIRSTQAEDGHDFHAWIEGMSGGPARGFAPEL